MQTEEFEIELGYTLCKLRKAKGKSQAEVAKDLGLHRKETVKQWESAERHIKASDLVKLSTYYGVSADYLLGLHEEKSLDLETQEIERITGLSGNAISILSEEEEDGWIGRSLSSMIEQSAGIRFLLTLSLAQNKSIGARYALDHANETASNQHERTEILEEARRDLRGARLDLLDSLDLLTEALFGMETLRHETEEAVRESRTLELIEIAQKTGLDDNGEGEE